MNKMSIGNYLENGIEHGTINADQICVYIDKNNNIKWIGKAEYAPIFLDWAALDHAETVGNELRLYEERTSTQAQHQEVETMTEPKPIRGTIASTGERCEMRANGYWTGNGKRTTSYERIDKPIEYNERGAQIRPHRIENRMKISFAISGDDWSSDREKAVYKALKNTKRRADIIAELIISYCEANGVQWGTLDTTSAQHYDHGKNGGGHFIISAYITPREE